MKSVNMIIYVLFLQETLNIQDAPMMPMGGLMAAPSAAQVSWSLPNEFF